MADLGKIHKITLPTGFPVGDVNIYLIKDDPITLIDTGVNGAITEHLLSRNLKAASTDFKDIKRIIITHTHLDHCGMAGRLEEFSGAQIFVFESKVGEIANFDEHFLKKPRALRSFYRESAVPDRILFRSMRNIQKSVYMSSRVESAQPLTDGMEIKSENFRFHVIHTPGHSDDTICLYEREKGILFSSDHITLYTPPFLTLGEVFARQNGEFGNMADYFESLRKVEHLDVSHTFPGHGELFFNHLGVISKIRTTYRERKEEILKILIKSTKSRFELTRALFGHIHDREIFKGIPEVTGHLNLLEKEGRLTKFNQNGIIYYNAKN